MSSPSGRLLSRQRSAQKTKVFDPKAFLANAGIGRTIRHYSPKQVIFSQGERADAVFTFKKGRHGLAWSPNTTRKRPLLCSAAAISWTRDASLRINLPGWQRRLQLLAAPSLRSKRERCSVRSTRNTGSRTCLLRTWWVATTAHSRTWLINCLIRRRSG
jgi:hypothetical protein